MLQPARIKGKGANLELRERYNLFCAPYLATSVVKMVKSVPAKKANVDFVSAP